MTRALNAARGVAVAPRAMLAVAVVWRPEQPKETGQASRQERCLIHASAAIGKWCDIGSSLHAARAVVFHRHGNIGHPQSRDRRSVHDRRLPGIYGDYD